MPAQKRWNVLCDVSVTAMAFSWSSTFACSGTHASPSRPSDAATSSEKETLFTGKLHRTERSAR
eukprot:CAMPEP_0179365926 /NCGR_PEP_ID=MMETSP0797-20121207/82798_1 /TAXON_ID=47934 /ORGANISM="Dinophysis acuminata, Strain DAEP01" /LENGTH=63 /DNA_ID=CAMNT_0021081435 /DNA_START=218 /DNA_END=406 /DNA_ORIENTATION=+